MRRLADQFGPQTVAFSQSSPSTTAIADSSAYVRRLMQPDDNGFEMHYLQSLGFRQHALLV